MKKILSFLIVAMLLSSCVISTAPMSVAWRSNSSQQYATTDGKNDSAAPDHTVNADKSSELKSAVSTSSGTAQTGGKKAPEKTAKKASEVDAGTSGTVKEEEVK